MLLIRQGATHKVVIGPVVAVGDGFTPVTTLAVSTADEAEAILHNNGTVVDISAYTFTGIITADGYYHLTLQAGISGTVGHMTVIINDDSLCLPVRADFTVIEEAVYDAMYAASAAGPNTTTPPTATAIVDEFETQSQVDPTGFHVNVKEVNGTAQTANDNGADINAILEDTAYIPAGLMPTQAEVLAIQNNTRVRVIVPPAIERPDADSLAYRLWLYLYDTAGNMEAPDSLPIVTAQNNVGTDRSANLSAVSNPSTGVYYADYTVASDHAIEGLLAEWTTVEGGLTRKHGGAAMVVDTTAVDFTAADRTKLDALHDTRLTAGRAGYLDALNGHIAQTGDNYTRTGAPAGASVSADVAAVKAETAAIVADTNELQTDDVPGLIGALDFAAAGDKMDLLDTIMEDA